MNRRNLIPLAIAFLLISFPLWTAPDKPPEEVQVLNFPDPQNVAGTVAVSALPPVSGTVSVNNTGWRSWREQMQSFLCRRLRGAVAATS